MKNETDTKQTEPLPSLVSPKDVLEATTLTRAEKIQRLRQMAYDERELQVASEEGMTGPGPSNMAAIQDALRQLGAEAERTDTKQ